MNGRDGVHDESRDEEEDDPVLLGVVLLVTETRVLIGPPTEAEALHEEAVKEQRDVGADHLVTLQLVEFVDEEEGAPGVDILFVVLEAVFVFASRARRHQSLLRLGPFPVDKVHVKRTLVEVDLEDHKDELAAGDPAE